jgi:hypothetical protein
MAEAAQKSIHQQYSKEMPVQIEVLKEPDNAAVGNATGIM